MINCETCGKEFEPRPWNAGKFCSRACSAASQKRRVIIHCASCGIPFELSKSQAKGRIYCSQECSKSHRRLSSLVELVCQECGKLFQITRGDARSGNAERRRKYCSAHCATESMRNTENLEIDEVEEESSVLVGIDTIKRKDVVRFWSKVKLADSDECWEWQAGLAKTNGYGWFYCDGKNGHAHRFSWQIKHGKIPVNRLVCHTCNNPACVNPGHLYLGTPGQNMQDKVKAGRQTKGSEVNTAKLCSSDVIEIRKCFSSGKTSVSDLAERYGMSTVGVRAAINGKSWNHVK